MNRARFLFCLLAGPFIISFLVLVYDRVLNTDYFESAALKVLLICFFLPTLLFWRSRYLGWTTKEFLLAMIPLIGWYRQCQLLQKP